MQDETKQRISETWDAERRQRRSEEMKKFWDERRDEIVETHRETDNRKHGDLKALKQTEFGTGVRDPEGYRDYQREVQRKYRANRDSKTMQYFRDYQNRRYKERRESSIKEITEKLDVPYQIIGRYVVTSDGRFFKISTRKQVFPSYIMVQGRLMSIKQVMERFYSDFVLDIPVSVDGNVEYEGLELGQQIAEDYYAKSSS